MWSRRSELFFDSENRMLPYIRHLYNPDIPRPYTRDAPNLFINRRRFPYYVRNPPASLMEIIEIESRYPVDSSNFHKYYLRPERQMISKSDCYYEIQQKRFLKRLFLYLEMREREIGLVASCSISMEDLLKILESDAAYKRYLEFRRFQEVSFQVNRQSSLYYRVL